MSNVIIPIGEAPNYLPYICLALALAVGGLFLAGVGGAVEEAGRSPKAATAIVVLGLLMMLGGFAALKGTMDRSNDAWDGYRDTVASAMEEQVGVQIPTDPDLLDISFSDDAQTATLKVKGVPVNCYVEVTDRTENETRLAVACGNDEFRLLSTLD